MYYIITAMDLRLFGEGAGAAAGGEGAGASTGETQAAPVYTRAGKTSGDTSNVLYGKQPSAQGSTGTGTPDAGERATTIQSTSDSKEARASRYREMIEGEFKDEYTSDFQQKFNQRFRDYKSLQERVDGYQPIVDVLAQRYGESDPAKLAEAINADTVYWQEAADEAGMTVENFREMQRLKAREAQFMEQEKRQRGEEAANAQIQKWYQEAETVKAKYPGFDLNAEIKDRNFQALLKSGTPMELAYKVMHMDEMMNSAVQTTAATTEAKVIANVKAKGARPAEGGASSQAAAIVKDDVHKLTKADRANIARRVARGEEIHF